MIQFITRDWGTEPSIVRLTADDSVATVLGATYIADQQDNINKVNEGGFTWLDNDIVLASLVNGTYFLNVSVAADETVTLSAAQSNQSIATDIKTTDDASASTVTPEITFSAVSQGAYVLNAVYMPNDALTANDTNYATLTIANRDASGALVGVIASITTETVASGGTGDWVAFVAEDFGDLSNVSIEAGGSITFEIEKAGAGVVVPAGVLSVEYVLL